MSSGKWCPLIRKNCVEHKCAFYTHVMGQNPNTGQQVDEWACAIQFLPMLLIENSQQQRGTGAAVESFRNEMVKANASNINMLEVLLRICFQQHIKYKLQNKHPIRN